MVVKIFPRSKGFTAVRYNTDKMESGKGELVKVSGFGALGALANLRPEDYVNYLSAVSSRSSRTVYPQFHAMISAQGRSSSKEELTSLAEKWLVGMGYGSQPYLLVFHGDTANNHIHLVSTRVGREGKKISDSYEKIRAYKVLNSLLGKDEKLEAGKAIEIALGYRFSTRAQFMMLLESGGYVVKLVDGDFELSKYGRSVGSVASDVVDARIAGFERDNHRRSQLRAIFSKYRSQYPALIFPVREKLPGGGEGRLLGYSSKLSEKLSSLFGLELLFHFRDDKPPYGYTVIDHGCGQVFKGSEIMPIAEFLGRSLSGAEAGTANAEWSPPVVPEGNLDFGVLGGSMQLLQSVFDISISDDIDDAQVLGRNRRRQKKARTNTR